MDCQKNSASAIAEAAGLGFGPRCLGQGVGAELGDAAVGADDEGQRERVPVFVGVRGVVVRRARRQGVPGAAVVSGDVGAVGADGDPGFVLLVVGDGRAVAVGRGLGGLPVLPAVGGDG